jgi:mono/diheme cytochrome c family protein
MRSILAAVLRCLLFAAALLLTGPSAVLAQQPAAPLVPRQGFDQPPGESTFILQPADEAANQPAPATTAPPANQLDPSLVAAGQSAFARSCVGCHDEQRSLQKRKTYGGWLGTVQRMAAKEGADINSADVVPIATYLTSVAGVSGGAGGGGGAGGAEEAVGGWSFSTTVSTLHRSASDEFPLENPGFFADVWVTAGYQSTGPWRAEVTACTSCHARDNGGGNAWSIELVEGSATLDLRHMFHGCRCEDGREILLKMGRFVAPFGAFAAMSHPGNYRTVTNPLMFNMGRRVFAPGSTPPQQPVLPAPFADEGINFMFRQPLGEWMLNFDAYAINGLQGTTPNTIFNRSRAYFDNNEDPAGGVRLTLGADYFRIGTSVQSGNLEESDLPRVYYTLSGVDITSQIHDRLRFYFEYAQRRQNSVFIAGTKETTYGIVTQLELRIWDHPYVAALASFDTLEQRSPAFGDATIERFTWGFNIGLPGGSLLMINHERWMPQAAEDVDVVGIRWTVSL